MSNTIWTWIWSTLLHAGGAGGVMEYLISTDAQQLKQCGANVEMLDESTVYPDTGHRKGKKKKT